MREHQLIVKKLKGDSIEEMQEVLQWKEEDGIVFILYIGDKRIRVSR